MPFDIAFFIGYAVGIIMGIIIGFAAATIVLRKTAGNTARELTAGTDQAIERVNTAINQFADVRAVVELSNKLHEDPSVVQDLGKYADDMVASALVLRLNGLNESLKVAQKSLNRIVDVYGVKDPSTRSKQATVDRITEQIKEVRDALKAERTPNYNDLR